jgi:cyanophycinase
VQRRDPAGTVRAVHTTVRGREIEVCAEECGEDLDAVTVLPGLGIVPFTVDVHAAQWGTLYRLVHGLAVADAAEGWAIDEHTTLEVDGAKVTVHGRGSATRLRGSELTVHLPGDTVTLTS